MSNKLFCYVGQASGEILTYQGRAIVHKDKAEMEFLIPGIRVVPLPSYWGEELTLPLKDHPDMGAVQFPLAQHMDQFQ
jgi:hypothetical protein